MSGPYRVTKDKHLPTEGSRPLPTMQIKKDLQGTVLTVPGRARSAVYLPIAAHFSFSQTFSASFRRGLSIS